VLLGNASFINKARRVRKLFGGGMRQAGFLAAAGIYALQNNIGRLKEDHDHARLIAAAVSTKDFVKFVLPVETNIIIFELHEGTGAAAMVDRLKEKGILSYAIAVNRVRFVLHLDITPDMVNKTLEIISKL
jgi:threonine aldolase